MRATALAHVRGGGRAYHYELAWQSAVPGVGAAHLVDVPFFFGNLDQPGVPALLGDEARTDPATVALGRARSAALAGFVVDGHPDADLLGPWPPYADHDRATMLLDRAPRLERERLAERLDFWSAHHDAAAGPLATTLGALE
ncbi:hypothetical protein BH09ACT5_BH09ACT5_15350 [soil metagenome]